MNYILLTISIIFESLKNGFVNYFGKNRFVTIKDNILFNIVSGVGATLFFLFTADVFNVSTYSLIMAAVFAVISAGASFFMFMAFSSGSMSAATLLVYLGSMVIPSVFGIVYYGQSPTTLKIIGVVLMIISIALSINLKKDKTMSVKWLLYSVASFIFWGLVGVCQQVHQNSLHAGEINEFLFWTFFMMTALFVVMYFSMGKNEKTQNGYRIKSMVTLPVLGSGVLIAIVYVINLYLAGKMPGIVLFPILNGGVLMLSSLAALIIFKEKLNTLQKVGIIAGIVSVCLLGI